MTQQYPLLSTQGTTQEGFVPKQCINTKTKSTFYDSSNHVRIKDHLR